MRANDADTIANEIIDAIKYEIFSGNPVDKIRFCEVGELRCQQDLEKIVAISNIVYEVLEVKSYIYTHNKYLNFDIERPFLTINGSNFMVDNEYRVLEKGEKCSKPHYSCLCDCKNGCEVCTEKHGIIITEEVR